VITNANCRDYQLGRAAVIPIYFEGGTYSASLAAGTYCILVRSAAAFEARHHAVPKCEQATEARG
jgi:hypothetical protein